ncbi:hypothetical protein [Nonomuraea roseola]|uniref:Uncharacterized protein n=1 Tax=Nonomuraea roseola TaxID=46179 RepID=A0ABV5QAL4_9ACTN
MLVPVVRVGGRRRRSSSEIEPFVRPGLLIGQKLHRHAADGIASRPAHAIFGRSPAARAITVLASKIVLHR